MGLAKVVISTMKALDPALRAANEHMRLLEYLGLDDLEELDYAAIPKKSPPVAVRRYSPSGRPREPLYNIAARQIEKGLLTPSEAYKQYCASGGINDRRTFNAAIRYRRKAKKQGRATK